MNSTADNARLATAQKALTRRIEEAGDKGAALAARAKAAGLSLPTRSQAARMSVADKAAAVEAILSL